MFMNENTHTYFYPTSSKAVVLECRKDMLRGKEGQAVLHPNMAQYIDALRAKRPTWKFKSEETVYGEGQRLSYFNIYDGDENLGRVWVENHWRTGETRYFSTNHRIKDAQQRRGDKFTSKLPTAVKNVLDNFAVKSPEELMADARGTIYGVVSQVRSTAVYNYERTFKKVKDALTTYILENWERLRVHAGDAHDVDLLGAKSASEDSFALHIARENGVGIELMLHGELCIIARKGAMKAKVVGIHELSEKHRAGLGILKLMDKGHFIPGVGVRASDTAFFLMD